MKNFFHKCDLSNVNFKYLDTRNVEKLDFIFDESTNININNDSPLNLKNCIEINHLFSKCDLSKVNFSFLNIKNAEKIKDLFDDCKNIIINKKSILNSKSCNHMENMFCNCDLENVDFSYIETRDVVNMIKFFSTCKNIKINDKSSLNLNNCVKMDYMFNDCDLKSVNFSFLKTENITSMKGFLKYSKNINITEKTNLNTHKVQNMGYFFQGCDFLILIFLYWILQM